jgi:nucleotide-binding universal stress UspA family protein
MQRVLLAVNGSACSLSAVQHVIRLARYGERLEIHLLNVQAPLRLNIAMFLDRGTIRGFQEERSVEALAEARALLDGAGLAYTKHVVVGRAAETIAEWAKKLRCDKVIMGTRGLSAASRILFGSVSHDTIRRIDPYIPVILVKADRQKPQQIRLLVNQGRL